MNNSSTLAEQQKKEITDKIRNRFLGRTHNEKLAESFKPTAKKLTEVIESTDKIIELFRKPDSEDGKTQKPPFRNVTGTKSLHDTSTLMKRKFFYAIQKPNGDVSWKSVNNKPLGENRFKDYGLKTKSIK